MKILFLAPYPINRAPSQRFRFEQYLDELRKKDFQYTFKPFLDEKSWSILYKKGHVVLKIKGVLLGFFRRFLMLFTLYKYDYVFVHREVSPIGPPIFEWVIAKVFNKKLIYDYDDAIWIPHISKENSLATKFRWHSKVSTICKWSYKICCGNQFLCDYALKFNKNVILFPTTIDTVNLHNKKKKFESNSKLIIGWTGTHSTMGYMDEIIPAFQELEKIEDFEFRVISDKKPSFKLNSLKFIKWKESTEIDDLIQFDVGIMPMKYDLWAEGKCGFKALQYMALGIPPIVSPKGVNLKIVEDGVTGFVCSGSEEWKEKIIEIINNNYNLEKVGNEASVFVKRKYSVLALKDKFIKLFS